MEKINGLEVLKVTIDEEYSDGEYLGIEKISYTSTPAILKRGVAFSSNKDIKKKDCYTDSVKMRIGAPVVIPMNIYRNDDWGEYYVQFTKEEIEQLYKKFMSNLKNQEVFNLEHDDSVAPSYVFETILCDTQNKIDYLKQEYKIELPLGSVFIVSQITDRAYYDELVSNGQTGYSIEGFLGFKMSEHIKNKIKANMDKKIPDGEHEINGMIYVFKDGEIIEVKEVTKGAELEDEKPEGEPEKEVDKEKETELEGEPEKKEDEKETELEVEGAPVAPEAETPEVGTETEIDEAVLMEILKPTFDKIYEMIAELKSKIVVTDNPETGAEVAPVAMSLQEKMLFSIKSLNISDSNF